VFTYGIKHAVDTCHDSDVIPVLALSGVADSSAKFGVGMTRTIERGDSESFQKAVKPKAQSLKA
jgi:hypothetical protein